MIDKTKRPFVLAAVIVAAVGAICLAYSYFIEPHRLIVKRDLIEIKDWNEAFDGLKIVMIGDIHGGSNGVTEQKLRRIVERTNAEEPDLIVLLGDYVSEKHESSPVPSDGDALRMPIETITANLSGFKAKLGVFAVLGNHDGWYGDGRIAREFSNVGIRVLRHEIVTVERAAKRLRLLGLIDHLKLTKPWSQTSDDIKQVINTNEAGEVEGPIIMLQHSPDIFRMVTGDLAVSDDLKLFLAAHTHGGQIWLPILGRPVVPSTFGQKYAYGHIRENNVDM